MPPGRRSQAFLGLPCPCTAHGAGSTMPAACPVPSSQPSWGSWIPGTSLELQSLVAIPRHLCSGLSLPSCFAGCTTGILHLFLLWDLTKDQRSSRTEVTTLSLLCIFQSGLETVKPFQQWLWFSRPERTIMIIPFDLIHY